MDFQTMQQELSDRVGAYDNSVSSDLTKLKRWLNLSQSEICGQRNWPFLNAHEIVQTVADVTTGTVSINSGSTTLTFSSGPALSATDWFIKFESSNSWYRISSHTAAATSATLSQAYGETSNLSAGTYTLRKLFYSTSTPLDSILEIKRTVTGLNLSSVSPRDADVFLPLYYDAGDPYMYMTSIPESDGDIRFALLYSPSSVENLQVRGIKQITDMSSDSDTPIIPAKWHSTILDMASFYAFSALDDDRAADFFKKAQLGIDDMSRVYKPDLGRLRVMRSFASGSTNGPAWTMPSNYGEPIL